MIDKYIIINNEYYEIYAKESLNDYVISTMEYSTNKIKQYLDFFNRIKLLNPDANPPKWAKGCFCGGEIQILLHPNMSARFLTLAHETFHLLFNKFVYDKKKFNRIVWLDESLAAVFSGQTKSAIESGRFLEILKRLLQLKIGGKWE